MPHWAGEATVSRDSFPTLRDNTRAACSGVPDTQAANAGQKAYTPTCHAEAEYQNRCRQVDACFPFAKASVTGLMPDAVPCLRFCLPLSCMHPPAPIPAPKRRDAVFRSPRRTQRRQTPGSAQEAQDTAGVFG